MPDRTTANDRRIERLNDALQPLWSPRRWYEGDYDEACESAGDTDG